MSAPQATAGHQHGAPAGLPAQQPVGAVPEGVKLANLPASPKAIGISSQHVAQRAEGLILKEGGFWIGDNFDIKRVDGTDLFDVEGKLFSISSKKEFRLAKVKTAENPKGTKGPLLFTIRKKHVALHTTFLIEDETGKDLAEIKNHMKLGGTRLNIKFTNLDGQPVELECKADIAESGEIKDLATGQPVAMISREFLKHGAAVKNFLLDKQTYLLTVAPGVDMALMAAICICLDEKNEKN